MQLFLIRILQGILTFDPWQKIFKDKEDFLKYLEILANYKKRYNYFLYIKKSGKEDIIDTDQGLRMFSGDKTAARKLYRVFMGGGTVRREDIYSTIDQRLLGGWDDIMEN